MIFWAKYNTQTTFSFPLVKRGVVDLAVSADYTPAAADSAISKDQAGYVDTTNTIAAVGGSPTRSATGWKLTLTAAELSAKQIDVQIVDAATKAVEDQFFPIYTYGNASAMFAGDWSDIVRLGLTALPNANAGASGGLATIDANLRTKALVDSYTAGQDVALRRATAAGGAAGTITLDGSANATDSYYNGTSIAILSGTGAGQARVITGYVGATKVATVSRNWTTNPDNTSVFAILPAEVDVEAWLRTAPATPATAGVPEINVKNINNVSAAAVTTVKAVQGLTTADVVASVTGAVGSVTGNVGGNVVGSVASVAGAVGSVTGNVGGNVVGSVASVVANVNADVKKINGTTVNGNGGVTPWGP